jgi:hypothetical protein
MENLQDGINRVEKVTNFGHSTRSAIYYQAGLRTSRKVNLHGDSACGATRKRIAVAM